ncbi:MAG: hypothetical protein LQ350_002751 [Teloschistes chrysophthalmus]|nr:MAG: hypothetical protein LQ350_002751 [Niorma chrysophthalma]
MTNADVRDMLGLPTDGQPKIRPSKKAKKENLGRRPGGLEREILGLHGDRPAPPLSITEVPKYKERPKRAQRPRHWEKTPFFNQARTDGLILRHWHVREDHSTTAFPSTPADSNAASEEQDERIPKPSSDYIFAKYNISVDRPVYTEEQYNAKLTSQTWTKDETDYLVNLACDHDLRWILIWDRYDYKPPHQAGDGDAMAVTVKPKHRTMEDLKARYYQVAAIAMALVNPLTSMSESEFAIHEKMIKFDPTLETKRKQFAEGMLSRSQDEIQEEEILLSELKRIVKNEEKFMQERQELYARLEMAPSNTTTPINRSSDGLTHLLKTLCEAEKNKRKRILGDGVSTPANGLSGQNAAGQGDRSHRQSTGGGADKRSSLSASQGQRQLSTREAARYGVTHHERLTAGVQFRHEKIAKLSQAKSNAQSQKISAALTELGIPARIYMPTAKTTNEYERLIQNINVLLDVRKVSEKVETEIRVIQAQREPKEQQTGDGEMKSPSNLDTNDGVVQVKPSQKTSVDAEGNEDADAETDEADEDADGDGDADADADADVDADADDDAEEEEEAEVEAKAEADAEEEAEEEDEDEEEEEEERGAEAEAQAEAEGGAEAEAEVEEEDSASEQGDSSSGDEGGSAPNEEGGDADNDDDDDADVVADEDHVLLRRFGSIQQHKRRASIMSTGSSKNSKRQKR